MFSSRPRLLVAERSPFENTMASLERKRRELEGSLIARAQVKRNRRASDYPARVPEVVERYQDKF